jgi:hypothetical protein
LTFQNQERKTSARASNCQQRISISKSRKEKRAQELVIANTELAFQSIEKKNGT